MKNRFLLGIALFLLCTSLCMADDVWTPETMMLERNPGNATISPDGKLVAFTVTEAVMTDEKSEYLTHIWISTVDGLRSYQLTAGEKSCNSPRWSPDSRWLAFQSDRSGKSNIWLIRPDGGEARQLTDIETGIADFAWSPDGTRIAFISSDPETEEEKARTKGKDDARIVGRDYKYTHIYLIEVHPETAEKPKPVRLTEGRFSVVSLDWSPDGKSIVFSHQISPEINDWLTADISVVSIDGGAPRPLVAADGLDGSPSVSPDGKTIAFVSDRGKTTWAMSWRLCLVPMSGGDVVVLPDTLDGQPEPLEWSPDGSGIYYLESDHTSSHLFFMPLAGEPRLVSPLPGIWSTPDISRDGSFVAFSLEDFDLPEEMYIQRLSAPRVADASKPLKISSVNANLPILPLAKSEVITWTSFDGTQIEGILHYPLKYKEGKRYPLLLNVHGGPAGVFNRAFTAGASLYPLQALQAKGFFILRPNPRGSSGYGWRFRFANINDWGGGDYKDLMAGVDYLINKGMADPDRLGVMGWSYGGYMTSWIITQTDRFKAAAVGAGVTDLVSFTGTTDVVGFIPSYFGGEVWQRNAVYREHSAVHNIGSAVTPTLILHGENDARVPIGQGYELYQALKRKGVDVEMVVYPRTPHGPQEPKLLLDVMNRHLRFFSERLLTSN
jgi:dipeptidyl aminopeptidase/acylaminoacyl peptidase